jgi:CDP-diacylglycerol--glycerol-3-phosphate 3-phosphatidyltransferase
MQLKTKLPNMLIVFRVLMIPVFLFFFLSAGPGDYVFRITATVIFLVAAISDFFDGHLARRWNTVSNFGKLMDPLADKMLVSTALVALAYRQELAAWVVAVIICREFWVTALRQLALEQGHHVIAASVWGKTKTVLQMTMLVAVMAGAGTHVFFGAWGGTVVNVLVYSAVFVTILSAVEYTKSYRGVFKT